MTVGVRWPAGLHPQGVRNTGGRPWHPGRTPQEAFSTALRALIGNGTGQAIVSNTGAATVILGPSGVGTRWYPAQVQVQTTTGPTDNSSVTLYRDFINPKQQIGQTLQGGGDTLGFTHEMQPGNLLIGVWVNANPGDLATLSVHGDQMVLSS